MNNDIVISESTMREIIQNISNSQKKIADSFQKIQAYMKDAAAQTAWEGTAYDAFLGKMQILEQNFPKINEKLLSYINFLEVVLQKYGKEENSLKSKVENSDGILNA